MADTKISALTAATTPLAGTEVLPIVQGGVTKKVAVADLTAGRAVSVASLTATGNVTAANMSVADTNWIGWGNYASRFTGTGGGSVNVVTNSVTAGTWDTSQNYIFYGNLTQGTAAKGINFTANTGAAGMTSQLLNWYEEGTWTPNQGAGLTVVGAFSSSGTYTRVGRQITVRGSVSGATSVAIAGTASQICTNLPYNSNGGHSGTMFNNALGVTGGVASSAAILYAVSTIAATPTITFTITYQI